MRGLIILSLLFAVLAGATAALAGPGTLPLAFGGIAVIFALAARFSQ